MGKYNLTKKAVRRLQAGLDRVTLNPEEWNQGVWAVRDGVVPQEVVGEYEVSASVLDKFECGTACCLAGRMVLDQGDKVGVSVRWSRSELGYFGAEVVDKNGEYIPFVDAVAHLLGINPVTEWSDAMHQLRLMADGSNSIYELWERANELADGRLRVPSKVVLDAVHNMKNPAFA